MLNKEETFRDEFFTPDPQITEYKKSLSKGCSDRYLVYLVEYTIEKKFLFIKRKYSTYKPGVYTFYSRNNRRELRVEEWVEIAKDDLRIYRVASVNDAVVEGESLQFFWK